MVSLFRIYGLRLAVSFRISETEAGSILLQTLFQFLPVSIQSHTSKA